jgi:hypothetical protein
MLRVSNSIFCTFPANELLEQEPGARLQVGDRCQRQSFESANGFEYPVAEYIVPEHARAQ